MSRGLNQRLRLTRIASVATREPYLQLSRYFQRSNVSSWTLAAANVSGEPVANALWS